MLWPFGKQVVSSTAQTGCLSVIANIIWIIVGGIAITINHLVMGIILYISIIGIPWGRQHFKMLEISLLPFGKKIIDAP